MHEMAHILKAANRHEIEGPVLGQPFRTRFTNGGDQVGVETLSLSIIHSTLWLKDILSSLSSGHLLLAGYLRDTKSPWFMLKATVSIRLRPKPPLISCTDITVVLKFMRAIKHDMQSPFSIMIEETNRVRAEHSIDVHAPLFLRSSQCHSLS